MHIVTFASTKGGVGKSTAAAVLTDSLLRSGATVRVLDFDDQGNFKTWAKGLEGRVENLTYSSVDLVKGASFADYYNSLVDLFEAESDWVVMDTKGTDDSRQPAALAISDLVIAPSGPVENELTGVQKTVEYLRLALKEIAPDVDPMDMIRILYRKPMGFPDASMRVMREVLFEHFGVVGEIHNSSAIVSFLGHKKTTDELIADCKNEKRDPDSVIKIQKAGDSIAATVKEQFDV